MFDQEVCVFCVMDRSARTIEFNSDGECNYCREFRNRYSGDRDGTVGDVAQLESLIAQIKKGQGNSNYDCVVGVSGGVDSSFVLAVAVRMGLRPLAVHMDNGWNTELAQSNISNLVRKLGVDLETHVIRWPEYREMMQAFFNADVIDVELLYDNAALAVTLGVAKKHGVKFILTGTNLATEGMRIPRAWNWYKSDAMNIRSIVRASDGRVGSTFPMVSTWGRLKYRYFSGIRMVSFLDYLGYNKEDALLFLERDFGYVRYPYKHYESVFTRFYQGFLLPEKFGVDKRKIHLSNLIVTGQMTRAEAIEMLATSPYPSAADLKLDRRFFLKKMSWSESDLQAYLERAERSHSEYANERSWIDRASKLKRRILKAKSMARRRVLNA